MSLLVVNIIILIVILIFVLHIYVSKHFYYYHLYYYFIIYATCTNYYPILYISILLGGMPPPPYDMDSREGGPPRGPLMMEGYGGMMPFYPPPFPMGLHPPPHDHHPMGMYMGPPGPPPGVYMPGMGMNPHSIGVS